MANNKKVNTTVIPADVFSMMTNQDKKEYDSIMSITIKFFRLIFQMSLSLEK